MVGVLEAIFLGIVQGITEWLPVSSSGHLVMAQEFLNLSVPLLFDILLHIGTLVVVFIVFWKEIKCVVLSIFSKHYKSYRPLLWFIIIGTIVTGVIGLLFKDIFAGFFDNLLVVGIGLLVTSGLLFSTRFTSGLRKLNWIDSVLIGIMQGLAIIPGISRSGSTISMGLLRGVDRQEAARFSFLLFIPAVIGALVLEWSDVGFSGLDIVPAIIGTLVAVVVGYFALKLLLKLILHEKFHYFGWYCLVVGVLLIVF